ncbi:MAG: ATP-dependent protease subunit HslV [Candidatus Latescibacteria bacterium ADurb.Bin168]|nr:MAG: ATP-dependent protease subunit HslV [Candidatus Latescibacteria bacterium ADurb.Bin168]
MDYQDIHATTVLGIVRDGVAVIGGDGQVTLGNTVVKRSTVKVRKLANNTVLAGFAGGAADAFALLEHFEGKLEETRGNLARAALSLARDWRTDKFLRRLEAFLIVMDRQQGFILSGTGDVIQPEDGVMAIGSGASYALAAAKAYLDGSALPVREIVERSLRIASDICIYTNATLTIEEL